ncbi:MAG: OmpA family protein [Muribaculum sp.]|nr:OmpA family protein [Muribaculum sp.]
MKLISCLQFVGITLLLTALSYPLDCDAQNFWKRVTNKTQTETQHKSTEKKGKKSTSVSPLELSLDENILQPAISSKDHEAVSRHMKLLAKKLSDRKIERIETMRNAEVVVATISTDMLFAPNDTVLSSKAPEILQPYTQLLRDHEGQYKLVLALHTDDTGSDEYTDKLSESRVNAVYDVLYRATPDPELLISYAMGASDPRQSNLSRQGRAANRRLEIYIVPTSKLQQIVHNKK